MNDLWVEIARTFALLPRRNNTCDHVYQVSTNADSMEFRNSGTGKRHSLVVEHPLRRSPLLGPGTAEAKFARLCGAEFGWFTFMRLSPELRVPHGP